MHWHGVRVPNGMDDVPHMTQPPIAPGGTFTYEFTPKDAGTFWFHPHVRSSEQVERGLYGRLIVEDAAPAPYTQDVSWILDALAALADQPRPGRRHHVRRRRVRHERAGVAWHGLVIAATARPCAG